jgi:hypothetical protein
MVFVFLARSSSDLTIVDGSKMNRELLVANTTTRKKKGNPPGAWDL